MDKKGKVQVEDIIDMTASAIDYVKDIAESSIEPVIDYSLGAVPVVKSVYSVFKRRQFEKKIVITINELEKKQERLEEILKTLEDRIRFGDKFITFLDFILFHEHSEGKIKYITELLVTSYERRGVFSYEEKCIDTLLGLSLEEIKLVINIRNYVVEKLELEHFCDIDALNNIKTKRNNGNPVNVLEEAFVIAGDSRLSPYRDASMFQRLVSYGFIEPRYGYYGDKLMICRYVITTWTFAFCDYIDYYSGKTSEPFLPILNKQYTSKKYSQFNY